MFRIFSLCSFYFCLYFVSTHSAFETLHKLNIHLELGVCVKSSVRNLMVVG